MDPQQRLLLEVSFEAVQTGHQQLLLAGRLGKSACAHAHECAWPRTAELIAPSWCRPLRRLRHRRICGHPADGVWRPGYSARGRTRALFRYCLQSCCCRRCSMAVAAEQLPAIIEHSPTAGSHVFSNVAATGTLFSVSAGRLSFMYGFCGPAVSIDTACSSAMVGTHQAAQHLQRYGGGALSAGVNLMLDQRTTSAAQSAGKQGPCAGPGSLRPHLLTWYHARSGSMCQAC